MVLKNDLADVLIYNKTKSLSPSLRSDKDMSVLFMNNVTVRKWWEKSQNKKVKLTFTRNI